MKTTCILTTLSLVCLHPSLAGAQDGGVVRVAGNPIADDGGPFLGLGWTYMTALWQCRNDRGRLRSDLAFMKQNGFNYLRALGEVAGDYWAGLEIAPVEVRNQSGAVTPAWPDYVQQLRDLLDIAWDEYGLRVEITIFGSGAEVTGGAAARQQAVDLVLQAVAGREHKVMMIEVANEGWQNGFGGSSGDAELRGYCDYMAARTSVPIAITSNHDGDMQGLYAGTQADLATWHFSRDLGVDDGWGPVWDCWKVGQIPGFPVTSSNEPIGPGSSVSSENDPIKLVMAAAFAYGAKLPMYVFHSSAGVRHLTRFEDMSGVRDYVQILRLLPPDLASWTRNDGKESSAPFTAFAGGQADRYWPENGAGDGCVRNIGGRKGGDFVCLPIGIRPGGLTLQARQATSFTVYHPLTGAVVDARTLNAGERFTLPQGPGAYIVTNFAPGSGGLNAEYFDNPDFTGTRVVRKDASIDFDWGTGSPAPGIGPDTFSVRWTGQVQPAFSETYTFITESDDGVRLWVNGRLLIDNWTDHAPTEDSGTIALTAGRSYELKMEYYENGAGALARLSWSSPSQPRQGIPSSALTHLLTSLASGWEDGDPLGNADQVFLIKDVGGPPVCSRRSGEVLRTGAQALRVSGSSNAGYAYCYFKLFDDDLLVLPGTKLRYWIWHEGTAKVSFDGHCSDGTDLRDSGLLDQYGDPFHPGRRSDPVGAWHYVEVDLSALAGKTIDFLLIGFDNGSDGYVGPYRAYLDDFSIGPTAGGGGSGGGGGNGGGGSGGGGGSCGLLGIETILLLGLSRGRRATRRLSRAM